jgi:hypothetical protein
VVDATAALAGYAACDDRAEVHREAYLSAFQFGLDFQQHLKMTGSTAGFRGACWCPWLWFDLDSHELQYAHKDAGALAAFLVERYEAKADQLMLFFSGSKGFHVGLPTAIWEPLPSVDFHRVARRFAEHVAELAAVTIDMGVYDKVRAFRAPNSRHPKTGLHKRRITNDELLGPLPAILELAKQPAPFTLPSLGKPNETAVNDWQLAITAVLNEDQARVARRAAGNTVPVLTRATRAFVRDGAVVGDRHRLLFSAAANLAEFGCPPELAVALLEEPALDSGLRPKEVCRQIECGLAVRSSHLKPESTETAPDDSVVVQSLPAPTRDARGLPSQKCQQLTTATDSTSRVDLRAALTRLWRAPPTAQIDQGGTVPPAVPEQLSPLVPSGAVASGTLDKPCRCGSREYAEIPISDGRSRRDCRQCGRFMGFGKWYQRKGE